MISSLKNRFSGEERPNPYDCISFLKLREGIRPGGFLLTGRLAELAGFKPEDKILDAGCGSGISIEFLGRQNLTQITGIDISHALLKAGTETFMGMKLVQGNAEFLPFKNSSFNGVIAECSISVMDYHARVLNEIHRVLACGGRLAISDIYLKNKTGNVIDKTNELERAVSQFFSRDEILKKLNDSGFNVIVWEDYSALWKKFVAGLILNDIPLCGVLGCVDPGINDTKLLMDNMAELKPGYFCLVAEKNKMV